MTLDSMEKNTITSHNEVLLTGAVSDLRYELVQGQVLVHASLETKTRMLRLNGKIEERKTTHNVVIWQMHVKNDVSAIKRGDIISIRGEIQAQPWCTPSGNWKTSMTIFTKEFEIVSRGGQLDAEDSI
mgnify:CR=1 FL=1